MIFRREVRWSERKRTGQLGLGPSFLPRATTSEASYSWRWRNFIDATPLRRNLVSINFPRQATCFGRKKRKQLNLASTYLASQFQKISFPGGGEALLTLPLSGEIELAYVYVAKLDDLIKEGKEGEPSRRRAISRHIHRSFLFLGAENLRALTVKSNVIFASSEILLVGADKLYTVFTPPESPTYSYTIQMITKILRFEVLNFIIADVRLVLDAGNSMPVPPVSELSLPEDTQQLCIIRMKATNPMVELLRSTNRGASLVPNTKNFLYRHHR